MDFYEIACAYIDRRLKNETKTPKNLIYYFYEYVAIKIEKRFVNEANILEFDSLINDYDDVHPTFTALYHCILGDRITWARLGAVLACVGLIAINMHNKNLNVALFKEIIKNEQDLLQSFNRVHRGRTIL